MSPVGYKPLEMRRLALLLAKIVVPIGIFVAAVIYGAPVFYAALLIGVVVLGVVIAADVFVSIRFRRWRARTAREVSEPRSGIRTGDDPF